jgi:hypothetical protein
MKRTVALSVVALLLAAACSSLASAAEWSWHGPFEDSCLFEAQPDSAMVAGETALWSPEAWIWVPVPVRAPEIYYLRVLVNGKPADLGSDVIKVRGEYMVPAEKLESLGLSASFSADSLTATVSGKGHTLIAVLDSPRATVDGFTQSVKVPMRWQRGMRYVSLSLLAQAFNLVVTDDGAGHLRISAY